MTAIVTVAVSPTSVVESGTTNLAYTFARTGDTSLALTVNIELSGVASATDYTINSVLAGATAPIKGWTGLLDTSSDDLAYALTTGLDGSIYVGGYTAGSLDGQPNNGTNDAFLTKYSDDGTKGWTLLLGSTGSEQCNALTTGLDGSIYVSGDTSSSLDGQTNSGDYDAFLTKLSVDGTKAWTRLLGSSGWDSAKALTTGLDGSIYVSGETTSASLDGLINSGGRDAFLTKYSSDGTKAWTRLLGSDSNDAAYAITTGLDGSIYISGYTYGSIDEQTYSGSCDAFLTKYSVDGTKAWTRFLGTTGYDVASALTTGLDGAIYVGGYTSGSLDGQPYSGLNDSFLIKYNADGTKAWTRMLGSSGHDMAFAVTTGLDGSIYLSGQTYDSYGLLDGQTNSGKFDAFLTKYSADGIKAWTRLLGTNGTDLGNALTTGFDGAIYLGGVTQGSLDGQPSNGGIDAFLTKFSVSPQITFAAGSSTATLEFDPTPDSLSEGSETIVVTVLAGTGYTVGTAAVATGSIVEANQTPTYSITSGSNNVNEGSTATFTLTTTNVAASTSVPYTLSGVSAADITGVLLSGTATLNSSGTATISVSIAADFLTEGAEILTITSGDASASTTVNDTSLSAVASVNVAVSPASVTENGATNLTYTFTRTGDTSVGLAVNIDLGGTATAADYAANASLVSTAGPAKLWTRMLGTSGLDHANALTMGLDGAIYIGGVTDGALDGQTNRGGNGDAFLTKYSADGAKVWTRLLGSSSGDQANALSTGLDGSIYVSGSTLGSLDGQTNSGAWDAFLARYNPDGTKAWTKLLGTSSNDFANAVTTGRDGSIYVAGYTDGSLDGQPYNGGYDAYLTKYSADGTRAWTRLLGSNRYDQANAVAAGFDGSIYVCGYTNGSFDGQPYGGGNGDVFLTKYGPDGIKAWTRLLGSSSDDAGTAVTIGLDGSIYVGGITRGSLDGQTNAGGDDAFLAKYGADGTRVWTRLLGTSSSDAAYALTTGLDGSIYIGGAAVGSLDGQASIDGGRDAFLTKYDASGIKAWTRLLGTNTDDYANALATGLDGSIYVGGRTQASLDGQPYSDGLDVFLTKFSVSPQITFAAGSSTATLVVDPTPDGLVEGGETVIVTVLAGTGYTFGSAVVATGSIIDTNQTPTYVISASSTTVNEGLTATFTLTTTNVASGTSVPYTLSGSVSAADITGGQLTGSVTISAAGAATISVAIFADSLTEGAETLTATVQSQSASVTVNDTSGNPVGGTNQAPTGNVTIGSYATAVGRFGDIAKSVAMQTDGKVLVGGYSFNGVDDDFALVRYNSDGSLDKSFGIAGKVTTAATEGLDHGKSVAVQADGKILLAGVGTVGGQQNFVVVRYNKDGNLDASFSGDGKVVLDFTPGFDWGEAVRVQSDGKILVAGSSSYNDNFDFSLVRFTADGNLDSTFSGDGIANAGFGSIEDYGFNVVTQNDGKIVVVGYAGDGNNDDFAVTRFNIDGSFDTGFGNSGKVITPVGSGSDIAYGVAIQSDGKILLSGHSYNGKNYDFAVVRYNTDGSLDKGFGKAGAVTTDIGGGDDLTGFSMALQADGKILVAGSASINGKDDFALVRYTTDGSLDTSFNGNGIIVTALGYGSDKGFGVTVQPDGKVVVVGSTLIASDNDFGVLRYNSNGSLDQSFVTITSTAAQGQTLVASNNLADADGLGAISYQWKAAGVSITGATTSTFVPTEAQVGKAITVVASYIDGRGAAESMTSIATTAVTNFNDPPAGNVMISGSAKQGETLIVTNTLADADGLGVVNYQWQAAGSNIAGATANSLVLTETQVGKAITVTASYTDGRGTAESVTSTSTAAVANVNDSPTGSVTIGGAAGQGQTLTAMNTLADADGLGAISYQWKAAGISISGATASTLLLAEAQVGKAISVVASYIDGHGTGESMTSSSTSAVANVNDMPTGGVTITGTVAKGQTLTAANTLADADGLGAIGYQWYAAGVAVTGANSNTLVLTEAQVGKAITVTASYIDGHGTPESITSSASAAVPSLNSAASGSVAISGTVTQGQVLTATHTLADADGLGVVSYQWQAAGSNIAGATANSLVLTETQVGKAITVTVSYTDGRGTAESMTSIATGPVGNVNDPPSGSVTIGGAVGQGQTLTAMNMLADADGLGAISYQWKASGINISGATASTLLLAEAQVGKTLTVAASYTDGHGRAELVSSAETPVVANVNDLPTGSVTITGPATQGQTLTATHTLADADGLGAISYQWTSGGSDIGGASGSTLVLTEALVGKAISVLASYTDGHGTAESMMSSATASVANVNDLPAGAVTINGTTAKGQTLVASNTLADADGLGVISYQWQAAGTAIASATGNTLLLADAQVGKPITVTASYTDGHGTPESIASSPSAAVTSANSATTDSLTVVGATTQGQTLTAALTLANVDVDGVISYQWLAAGSKLSGAIGSTLVLTEAMVGQAISAVASYTVVVTVPAIDGGENIPFIPAKTIFTPVTTNSGPTAAVVNLNDPPIGSVTIGGSAKQGETLTAANTLADVDGLGAISYQWKAAGTNISGATASTLVLTEALVGKAISLVASYTDGHSTAESIPSGATAAVANVNDLPSGKVTVNGTATQGQVLTATNTLVDADGLGAIGYQWHADGLPIVGATANTLLLGAAQAGKAISVLAGYLDGHGTAEAVASLAVQVGTAGKAIDLQAYSWKTHTLLSAVVFGDGSHSGSTDALGAVKLSDANGAALTASRTVPSAESADTSQAVNLQDAIAILKMIVGLDVNGAGKALSPYQAYAADFDGNGKVELSDAIGVLKHVVGLPAPDVQWLFFNETDASVPGKSSLNPGAMPALTATLATTGATHVGLVGALRGDVDGSYTGGGSQSLDLAYFQHLGADMGLNLTQFGVYGP